MDPPRGLNCPCQEVQGYENGWWVWGDGEAHNDYCTTGCWCDPLRRCAMVAG